MSVFLIAEAGVNHGGDFNKALTLVEEAKRAGADAVKFQTYFTRNNVSQRHAPEHYKKLASFEFLEAQWRELKAKCDAEGIEFMSTPGDQEALDLLLDIGMKRIKISSDHVTNPAFLRYCVSKKLPVYMSTGMSTLAEWDHLFNTVDFDLYLTVFMHCVSEYPVPPQLAQLKTMKWFKDVFFGCRVGYSDHTVGTLAPSIAAALGAEVVEKHLILAGDDAVDKAVSLEPLKFAEMARMLRETEYLILQKPYKHVTPGEGKVRALYERGIYAKKLIMKGQVITDDMLIAQRPKAGVSAMHWQDIVGQKAIRKIKPGEPL